MIAKTLLLLSFLFPVVILAQEKRYKISGSVQAHKSYKGIQGAHIIINNNKFGVTDKKGDFTVANITDKKLLIKISCVGYKSTLISYILESNKQDVKLPTVVLKKTRIRLEEISVSAEAIPLIQKGDTIEYNVVAFKLQPNATARQLVDALPGMRRDKNNRLSYNGRLIRTVRIDDRIFHKEIDVTLEAIPADILQKVQVYDEIDEISKFTGFNSGTSYTTINLVTKYKKLKFGIGRFGLAHGTDDRYSVSTSNSLFLGASRFLVEGNMNNISKERQLAYWGDFVPIKGDTDINKLITMYNWEHKNTQLYSDYSLETISADTKETENRDYYGEEKFYSSSNDKDRFKRTHKVSVEIKSFINKRNKIKFIPEISFEDYHEALNQNSDLFHNLDTVSNTSTNTNTNGTIKTIGGKLRLQSILSQKIYLCNILIAKADKDEKSKQTNGQINKQNVSTFEKWIDETKKISYNITMMYMNSSRGAFKISNKLGIKDERSQKNNNTLKLAWLKNRTSIGYIYKISKALKIRGGLGYENTKTIKSDVDKRYYSVVGNFNATIGDISTTRFSFSYSREANTPTLYQLYDFYDASNPLYVILGNINLRQSYNNNFLIGLFDISRFHTSCNFSFAENFIAHNFRILDNEEIINNKLYLKGSNVTSYRNMSGYFNIGFNFDYTQKIFFDGFRLNYNFRNVPSLIDGQKNISKQNTVSLYSSKKICRNKNFNANLSFGSAYNWSKNTLADTRLHFLSSNISANVNIHNIKNFYIGINYKFTHDYQPNIEDRIQTINLLSMEIGRRFLNNSFEVSFKGFDLLNQNNSILTKFTPTYVQYNTNNNLKRYLMFSVKYYFNTLKRKGGIIKGRGVDPSDYIQETF